jgi:HlyD family secretion protein
MVNKKRFKNRRTYYILGAAAIILILIVRAHLAGGDAPIIRTASVDRGTVTAIVSANGTLQPFKTIEVKSNVGGSIVKLAVDEGDSVKAGQLVAKIDPTDSQTAYDQSQADLAASISKDQQAKLQLQMQRHQSAADIYSAQQALSTAQTKLLQAKEQANVQPALTTAALKQAKSNYAAAQSALNQTKTALVPQKLSSAKAAYDQAQASLAAAERDYNRQKALLDKGYVSKSQFDASEEKYNVAKATLDSAKIKLDTINDETAEDLRSAEAKLDQSKAELDSATANQIQDKLKHQEVISAQAAFKQAQAALKVAKANALQVSVRQGDIIQARAQVKRSQAAFKSAQTNLGYTTVVAPCDGIVTKKYVEEGSIVTAGRTSALGTGSGVAIVDIADETKMTAVVDVDETDIAQVEVGQEVDMTVEAYPDELFTGKVTKIAPQSVVDQNVTTIPVTVDVELPDARLKPGMNVTCDFVTGRKTDVLMVPNEAVKEADNGNTVTVIENGKQVERKVEAGLVGKDNTEIIKGLKRGEKVVTAVIEPTGTTATTSRSRGFGMMGGPPPR